MKEDDLSNLLLFVAAEVPSGYRLQYVHGFVEELVVNDDPEYQWIDKIRTPRSSNEARQRLFSKMSGRLEGFSFDVVVFFSVCKERKVFISRKKCQKYMLNSFS